MIDTYDEWHSVLFNGLETNLQVTKCGRVKKIKVDWSIYNRKIGEVDFTNLKLTSKGYKQFGIKIKGLKTRKCHVHQLVAAAFLGYKFEGNKNVVDHIDSNILNNHVNNLRLITNRENCSKERTLKRGLPVGVSYDKKRNKWLSQIYLNKKKINLGRFNTIEEASNAYQLKLKSL